MPGQATTGLTQAQFDELVTLVDQRVERELEDIIAEVLDDFVPDVTEESTRLIHRPDLVIFYGVSLTGATALS